MKPTNKNRSFSYYFLNKRLHSPTPSGFRNSIVNLIVSQNSNKLLFVKQNSGFWNLPKEGIQGKILVDDIFSTIGRLIEEELGFRGLLVNDLKPWFKQKALVFDFDRQLYDKTRSKSEQDRSRPSKGKIYHLAIMEYFGPEELPIPKQKNEILDYKWVSIEEGEALVRENKNLPSSQSSHSIDHNILLFTKVINAYKALTAVTKKAPAQLFD